MKIKYSILILFTAFLFVACEEFEKEFSVTFPFNGRYYVEEMYDDSSTYGPYQLLVSNTSGNSADTILIDNIYDSGIRVKARVSGKTFSITEAPDINGNVPFVTIKNGSINEAKKTINFEVYLLDVDSLGVINDTIDHFIVSGQKATGFE